MVACRSLNAAFRAPWGWPFPPTRGACIWPPSIRSIGSTTFCPAMKGKASMMLSMPRTNRSGDIDFRDRGTAPRSCLHDVQLHRDHVGGGSFQLPAVVALVHLTPGRRGLIGYLERAVEGGATLCDPCRAVRRDHGRDRQRTAGLVRCADPPPPPPPTCLFSAPTSASAPPTQPPPLRPTTTPTPPHREHTAPPQEEPPPPPTRPPPKRLNPPIWQEGAPALRSRNPSHQVPRA